MGDMRSLAVALRTEAGETKTEAARVVKKGALNVKNQWRKNVKDDMSTPSHIPFYPSSITFELYDEGLTAIIAPNTGRQAKLGVILEYGTVDTPPHRWGAKALQDEKPRFIANMKKIAGLESDD